MNTKLFCLLSISFLYSGLTFSQKKYKEDPLNIELTKCLDKKENQTTAGMCNCTYESLDKWDKRLNITYKNLISKLDSSAKPKLIEAQRQWIKFKEKEINLIDATFGSAQGTMWRIVRAEKVLDITRARTADLEEILKSLEEFY
jgi:uncharacterized protein YecT (DUF1311 family)